MASDDRVLSGNTRIWTKTKRRKCDHVVGHRCLSHSFRFTRTCNTFSCFCKPHENNKDDEHVKMRASDDDIIARLFNLWQPWTCGKQLLKTTCKRNDDPMTEQIKWTIKTQVFSFKWVSYSQDKSLKCPFGFSLTPSPSSLLWAPTQRESETGTRTISQCVNKRLFIDFQGKLY